MGDDPAKAPSPPKLPSKTPRSIRKFVACETDSAELRQDNIGWLPEFGGLPDPTVTLDSGSTPGSAKIVLSWMGGFVNLTIAAAVVDGALQVEPPDVPSQLGGDQVTDVINQWTSDLNAVLKFHEKQLSGLTVNDGVLRLTKSDIIAHDETEASSSTATTVPPTGPPPSDSSPPSGSSPPATGTPPGGCSLMFMMLMIAFLGVVAVGVFLLVGGGSDEDTAVGGGDKELTDLGHPRSSNLTNRIGIGGDVTPAEEALALSRNDALDDLDLLLALVAIWQHRRKRRARRDQWELEERAEEEAWEEHRRKYRVH